MSDDGATERQRVLVAGLWSASSVLVPLVGTAALSIVMGRILGPSLLGQQSLIAYVEATAATLLIGALTDTFIRTLSASAAAETPDDVQRLERWATVSILVGGLLTAAIVAGIGMVTDDPLPWLVAALASAINGAGWGYGARLIARDGWSPVATRRLLWQTLAQALGIVAVLVGLGVAGVFLASVIAAAGVAVMLRHAVGPMPRGRMRPFPRPLVGLWLSFVVVELLTQVVSKRIEFVFLGILSTTAQIAMYSIPFMLVSSAAMLPTSIFIASMPAVAASAGAGRLEETAQALAPALRVTALLSLPMAAGVVVVGPRLITVLYGPEFAEAAALVPILAVSLLITPLADVCTAFWLGAGRTRRLIAAISIGGAADIALAIALIGPYGALGAAIANAVGQSLAAVILVISTWRGLALSSFPWWGWVKNMAVSALALAAGVLVLRQLPGWAGLLAATAASMAILVGYGWVLGLVRGADARWLRNSVPGRLGLAARLVTGPLPDGSHP